MVGGGGGTLLTTFYDQGTTGQTTASGSTPDVLSGAIAVGGTTGRPADSVASYPGLDFATAPGAAGFVIIDTDATLNGLNGGTRPLLLSEFSTQIMTGQQLTLIGVDLNADYVLTNNLDLTSTLTAPGTGFTSLGSRASPFNGQLTGDFLTTFEYDEAGDTPAAISNLHLSANRDFLGLFAVIGPSGSVSNLALNSSTVSGTGYVGLIAGDNYGLLSNVSASGSVAGASGVGGLVGVNEAGATITRAMGNVQVVATGDDVGGVAGANFGATDGYNDGLVSGADFVGGIVGYNAGTIGQAATSFDTYVALNVQGANFVGGIAGINYGSITNYFLEGSVYGQEYVGGAAGWNAKTAQISLISGSGYVAARPT